MIGEGYGTGQAPQRKPVEVVHDETEKQQPDTSLADAIAAHFGIEPDALTGFIVSAEYRHEVEDQDTQTLSSAWSAGTPAWRLRGFAAELAKHLESV